MSKWMKAARVFVAAAVIGLVAGNAMAAKGPNEPNRPGHQMREGRPMGDPVEMRVKMLTERLTLTEKQQGEVKPILQDQMKQMQALRSDKAMPQEQRQAKMQEIRKESNQKIEQLLTPEQKEKFKKMQESQMAGHQGKGPRQGGEHGKAKVPDSNSKQ